MVLFFCIPILSCQTTTERENLPPLQTVKQVDLNRYSGTWYEIASFPQWFQKGCVATTATYTVRSNGEIDVVNRCRINTLSGREKVARGRARVVAPAKLQVSFFRPFWGNYWIIDLGKDYTYAVVSDPGRDTLWILSRTPEMDEALYEEILDRLQKQQLPLKRLEVNLQASKSP